LITPQIGVDKNLDKNADNTEMQVDMTQVKKHLFMCGTPRSGTSYLATIIGSHPSIVMGVERYKHHYAAGTLGSAHFEKERFFDLRPEDTGLPGRIVFPGREAMIEKFDRSQFVGDKYPIIIRRIDVLRKAFPGSTFLFVLRNPIHVARSWLVRANDKKDHWPEKNDFNAGIDYWLDSIRRAVKARQQDCNIIVMNYDLLTTGDEDAAAGHLGVVLERIAAPASPLPVARLLKTRGNSKVGGDNAYTDEESSILAGILASKTWSEFMMAFSVDEFTPLNWPA
jgi:hypothetical protein